MINHRLSNEQVNQAVGILCRELAPVLIYLFGSAACGRLRADSDIDLAFWSDQSWGEYQVFVVAQQLAEQLGREVDLIDLPKASTVLQAQIVGRGKNIYASEIDRKHLFEMRTLKEYALLNEERQAILDKLVRGVKRNEK